MKPLFYVELKKNEEKNSSSELMLPGFDEQLSVIKNFSKNKKYPVVSIIDDDNIQVPDDEGILQVVSNRLFKYSEIIN